MYLPPPPLFLALSSRDHPDLAWSAKSNYIISMAQERNCACASKTAKTIQEFDNTSPLGCFSDRFTRRFFVSVEEEDREASSRDKVQGCRSNCPRGARSIRERETNGRRIGDDWGNGWKCEMNSKCIAMHPRAIIRSHVSNRKRRTIGAVHFSLSNEWEWCKNVD